MKYLYEADPLGDGKSKLVLRSHNGTDEHICQTARNSLGNIEVKKTERENERLLNYLYEHRHTSPLEFADYDFILVLPLCLAQQWFRHRTGKFTQTSERFTLKVGEYYIPKVEEVEGQSEKALQCRDGFPIQEEIAVEFINDLTALITQSEKFKTKYKGVVANEIVRLGTLHSLYTTVAFKMDLNNLLHFVNLRLSSDAQKEIQKYAKHILECIKIYNPLIYKSFITTKFYVQKVLTNH